MAFGVKKIFPLDTKNSVAVGIGIPFNEKAVFKSTYLTKDAIKANIINYFLSNKKERYFNNNFGANLRAFIFEQITNDNLSFLKEDIQSKLNQYFSNVNVTNLEINSFPDTNTINFILFYSIPNTGITDKVEINF